MILWCLNTFFWAIGLILVGYQIVKGVKWFAGKYVHTPFNFAMRYGEGSYAIITGASDGIGREFAIQLAKRGLNLVLISRTQSKLEEVSKEISKIRPSAKTIIIVKDFAAGREAGFYDEIKEKIANIDVSMLVNNVGKLFGTADMLTMNVYVTALLTEVVLPKLLARNKRSALINLSSLAGISPAPFFGVYSATKAFDEYLVLALGKEYDDKLDYLSVTPGYVSTPMIGHMKVGSDCATTEDCVTGALNDLGHLHRSYGSNKHKIRGFIFEMIPLELRLIMSYKMFANAKKKE